MMQLIIIRSMQEFPSDQDQSSSIATIEKYNDISIPFDPAIYSFPQQLFHLLQIAEHTKQEDIISWAEDGKSFTVHDPNEFEATLLVKCFQMKKYASFTRQLCAYGFSCVRKGRKPGLYYHPNFVREDYDVCSRITRGSGKAYPKKAVTYTGAEMPSNSWNLEHSVNNYFPSTFQMVEDTRKPSKSSTLSSMQDATYCAPATNTVPQELLHTTSDRATRTSPAMTEHPWEATSSQSQITSLTLSPPADAAFNPTRNPTQTSNPTNGHVRSQSLPSTVADVSFMEPRSIQDMMDAPDLSWGKRKRES